MDSVQVRINQRAVTATVVEIAGGGMRLGMDLTDWRSLGVGRGHLVAVQKGFGEVRYFVESVLELRDSESAWVMLVKRMGGREAEGKQSRVVPIGKPYDIPHGTAW